MAESKLNLILILAANVVLGSIMPLLIILGGLSGHSMAPYASLATLPPSVQMLAGLIASAPLSLFMGKFGRKLGFLVGAACSGSGGIIGVLAWLQDSFLLICVAHMLFGISLAAFAYFRFAAAETVDESRRPVAVSLTIATGLLTAFIGPELFDATKDLMMPLSIAGAYWSAMGLSIGGAAIVLL
ncbi:MAG: MFS transporter, partial [Pseudomonadota bacterium]